MNSKNHIISPSPSQLSTSSSNNSDLLPSGGFSLTKAGEELRIRPKSPNRYKPSLLVQTTNGEKQSKHCRSSTYTSTISRFIPATELVSFDSQGTDESRSLNGTDDELDSLNFEEEPEHLAAYPSFTNSRHAKKASFGEFTGSSPLDPRLSTLESIDLRSSAQEMWTGYKKLDLMIHHLKKLREFKEKHFVARDEMIFCGFCKENVNFSVVIKNVQPSL
jgi:hypothetical protein